MQTARKLCFAPCSIKLMNATGQNFLAAPQQPACGPRFKARRQRFHSGDRAARRIARPLTAPLARKSGDRAGRNQKKECEKPCNQDAFRWALAPPSCSVKTISYSTARFTQQSASCDTEQAKLITSCCAPTLSTCQWTLSEPIMCRAAVPRNPNCA